MLNKLKYKVILGLVIIIGTLSFMPPPAPPAVVVDNDTHAKYIVRTEYTNGSSWLSYDQTLDVYSSVNIPATHPNNQAFEIDHWKIFVQNCTPTLVAEHVYQTPNVDEVTHCGECDYYANSTYDGDEYDIIACHF